MPGEKVGEVVRLAHDLAQQALAMERGYDPAEPVALYDRAIELLNLGNLYTREQSYALTVHACILRHGDTNSPESRLVLQRAIAQA